MLKKKVDVMYILINAFTVCLCFLFIIFYKDNFYAILVSGRKYKIMNHIVFHRVTPCFCQRYCPVTTELRETIFIAVKRCIQTCKHWPFHVCNARFDS